MNLTPAVGQMYSFVDYVTNPIKGVCPFNCRYCYVSKMKRFPQVKDKYTGIVEIREEDLNESWGSLQVRRKENLSFMPKNKCLIFVGSANDYAGLKRKDKLKLIETLWEKEEHYFLIQSKDPSAFTETLNIIDFPPNTILGTTIETDDENILNKISKAPPTLKRVGDLNLCRGDKMVSIEPIMDFDYNRMVSMIENLNPLFVSIGADSGNNNLTEPSSEKIRKLINRLSSFTEIHLKSNLFRLMENKE